MEVQYNETMVQNVPICVPIYIGIRVRILYVCCIAISIKGFHTRGEAY